MSNGIVANVMLSLFLKLLKNHLTPQPTNVSRALEMFEEELRLVQKTFMLHPNP